MKYPFLFSLLTIVFCYTSCKKDKLENIEDILLFHRENAVTDSLQITALLQGNWQLIHYDCSGNCVNTEPPPEATLSFTGSKGELYFKEADGTIANFEFDWYLEKLNRVSETNSFQLITNPRHEGTYFQTFSENHLSYFGFHTPLIVYEKQ